MDEFEFGTDGGGAEMAPLTPEMERELSDGREVGDGGQ